MVFRSIALWYPFFCRKRTFLRLLGSLCINGFSCSVRNLQLWKLLSISTNGRPSLSRTLKPVTFTVQNSKSSRSQISSKQIITIVDEAEITASTNVLLIYTSKQRLFCTPCSCSKRSYPKLAHPPRLELEIWEQNYCLSTSGWTAHALLMANEMPSSNASKRSIGF